MTVLPPTLEKLLSHNPPSDDAWSAFAREYTGLLLHVARSTSHGGDDAMDAYVYLLDRLREDGCRRLRGYVAQPRSKFTTWLVVVTKRLCIDHYRLKYGRLRHEESREERERLDLRRGLANLNGPPELAESIADENPGTAADAFESSELSDELRTLVTTLPPEDRLLLRLRFDDDLSASEIARILRLPSQFHVYRRINAILAELRVALEARGFESAAS